MPTVSDSMQDLSTMLGDIVTGSSITHDGTIGQIDTVNSDASAILEEAQSIVEGNARQSMPEPPSSTTIESILQEREQI